MFEMLVKTYNIHQVFELKGFGKTSQWLRLSHTFREIRKLALSNSLAHYSHTVPVSYLLGNLWHSKYLLLMENAWSIRCIWVQGHWERCAWSGIWQVRYWSTECGLKYSNDAPWSWWTGTRKEVSLVFTHFHCVVSSDAPSGGVKVGSVCKPIYPNSS